MLVHGKVTIQNRGFGANNAQNITFPYQTRFFRGLVRKLRFGRSSRKMRGSGWNVEIHPAEAGTVSSTFDHEAA